MEIALKFRIRWQVCAIGLGLISPAVIMPLAHAQSSASFSALTGQPNLTALPGQNVAQQTMSGSINNFCPTVAMTAVTPTQIDLKTICSGDDRQCPAAARSNRLRRRETPTALTLAGCKALCRVRTAAPRRRSEQHKPRS